MIEKKAKKNTETQLYKQEIKYLVIKYIMKT